MAPKLKIEQQHKRLHYFDLQKIEMNSTIILIGRRGSGKSTVVKNILDRFQHIETGIVFSPTESANQFYSDMVPKCVLYDEVTEEKFNKIKSALEQQLENFNNGLRSDKPCIFIVMDDCLYKDEWKKKEFIKWIFLNGRHYNILFILTIQDCLGIPPILRSNTDFTFVLKDNQVANRKRIYEHYAGSMQNQKQFDYYMNKYTKNRKCLVLNNKSLSTKVTKNAYFFRADPNIPSPILCPGVRQYLEQRDKINTKQQSKAYEAFQNLQC